MIQVVVREEDGVDALVPRLRGGEAVERAAAAVDHERVGVLPAGRFEEEARLEPLAGRHRAPGPEEGHLHG